MSNPLHPTSSRAHGYRAMASGRPTCAANTFLWDGKRWECAMSLQHLLRDSVHLLTLIGPPGIGKTRLSLEVAARIADHFADGVWFVNLARSFTRSLDHCTFAPLEAGGGRPPPLRESLSIFLLEKRLFAGTGQLSSRGRQLTRR